MKSGPIPHISVEVKRLISHWRWSPTQILSENLEFGVLELHTGPISKTRTPPGVRPPRQIVRPSSSKHEERSPYRKNPE